eukprot:670718-Prorocentrum_lima.AAC.1
MRRPRAGGHGGPSTHGMIDFAKTSREKCRGPFSSQLRMAIARSMWPLSSSVRHCPSFKGLRCRA